MDDILAKMAAETDDVDAPTEDKLQRLQSMCSRLADMREHAEQLDRELKEVKKKIWDMETKEIPDFASEIGVDKVGIPERNVDVVVEPYFKANISSDWSHERREEAFTYLENEGFGDIIRRDLNFSFGRDSDEAVAALLRATRQVPDAPEPTEKKNVPWNTLTSLLREQTKKGVAMDLEKIGATVGQMAKIKERN